jgi:hypothetical protein
MEETTYITEQHYQDSVQKIYEVLVSMPTIGLGEMGECREEATRILDAFMEEQNIEIQS